MKKFVYEEDSLKHIECSIVAFNGVCPIKHFDNDDSFLMAWKARSLQKKKFTTVSAFEKFYLSDSDNFYRITKKLRSNMNQNKPGELKAYSFFRRYYNLEREEVNKRLGIQV